DGQTVRQLGLCRPSLLLHLRKDCAWHSLNNVLSVGTVAVLSDVDKATVDSGRLGIVGKRKLTVSIDRDIRQVGIVVHFQNLLVGFLHTESSRGHVLGEVYPGRFQCTIGLGFWLSVSREKLMPSPLVNQPRGSKPAVLR